MKSRSPHATIIDSSSRGSIASKSLAAALLISVLNVAAGAPPILPDGVTLHIHDRVYVIPDQSTPLVPNVGIVVGTDFLLVIDTGMGPRNAEIVLSEVRKISELPIKYLVTTHFHPEHNFGAQSFPDETILIYARAQHQDLLNKGERYRNWFVELFGDDVRDLLEPVILVQPDVTFDSRADFNLGNLRVELHHFGKPAHTGGDTVAFLPEQRIAFVGDLVPHNTFPIMPDEDSSVRGWLETLEQLKSLGATTIVPSHGKIGGADLIDTVINYLSSISARASELKAQGVPLESAQQQLLEAFTTEYPDWGEQHWINNTVELAYAESGPAL